MSDLAKNLINAIRSGDAMEIESAFNAGLAEKISAKLDDMRVGVAQNMFKTPEAAPAVEAQTETPAE
jgi:hypothetical protein